MSHQYHQQQQQQVHPQQNDVQFPNMPSDSVSCLALNGTLQTPTTIVAAGAWDCSVNCYEVQ